MSKTAKKVICILAVMLIVSLVMNFLILKKYNKEKHNQFELFRTKLFFKISYAIDELDVLTNNRSHKPNDIYRLTKTLYQLDSMSLIMNLPYPCEFGFIADVILGLANRNNYSPPFFLEDGEISSQELEFLWTLETDLTLVKNKLGYNEGSHECNPRDDISYAEVEEIIASFFNKWGYDENADEDSPFIKLVE